MLNHITLMGRLCRDPELRYTQSAKAVCSFSLAVERDYAGPDGARQTDFIRITAWEKTAEFIHRYFTKGQLVAVSGRLQIQEYTDKDGTRQKLSEVLAAQVYFAESKWDRKEESYSERNEAPVQEPPRVNTYQQSSFAALDDDDGDLPF